MAAYKINDGYMIKSILDGWIIIPVHENGVNGTSVMSVNESGYLLWELLEQGADENRLLDKLLDEYEIDADTVARDIKTFIGALLEKGVVSEIEIK